jgi:hypothetical protein
MEASAEHRLSGKYAYHSRGPISAIVRKVQWEASAPPGPCDKAEPDDPAGLGGLPAAYPRSAGNPTPVLSNPPSAAITWPVT